MDRTETAPRPLQDTSLAALPGIRHGFFTRHGGVSDGAFESLNCGWGSGDDHVRISENRDRAAQELGMPGSALATAHQVHGTRVVRLDRPWKVEDAAEADGLVTDTPDVLLGILTADCVPVLLADASAGIIGAAHAGWRGAKDGIIAATVEAMVNIGADPAHMVAGIGPAIAQRSYEVGEELFEVFVTGDATDARFFEPGVAQGKYQFDLAGLVTARLEQAGVASISGIEADTCAADNVFFSYRRVCLAGGRAFGRGLSAIGLAR